MLARSMWTAVSGVMSHQDRMDVIGNNIANVNNVGFKKSNQSFNDIFSKTLSGGRGAQDGRLAVDPLQLGLGVQTGAVTPIFSQGGFETTTRELDLAIEGSSFFVTRKGDNEGNLYTRDGTTYLDGATDADGRKRLLTGDGLSIMGWNATNNVLPNGDIEEVFIPVSQTIPGSATSSVSLEGNLDASRGVVQPNQIATAIGGPGWISNTGATINVGHVETSRALWSKTTGNPATAAIDLADLQYSVPSANGNRTDLFNGLAIGDVIGVNFDKGGINYSENFTYGQTGTTLSDLATWLAGGLGDAGAANTERLNGGVLGTIRTAARTDAVDGYAAPAEAAGAYLQTDGAETKLSIASNLGSTNAIQSLSFLHNGARINSLFDIDPQYGTISDGGFASSGIDTWVDDGTGTIVAERNYTKFALVQRDNDGSTWRWISDGGGTNNTRGTGTIRFDTNGKLINEIQDTPAGINFTMPTITQVATFSDIGIADQDGYPEGAFENFNIDSKGVINGYYDNGLNQTLARIALASIPNPAGLYHLGDDLWRETVASGEALINSDIAAGGFGSIRSSTLESSNVNLSQEMTNMMLTQRGWQANSKAIVTTDEMLQELARLKR